MKIAIAGTGNAARDMLLAVRDMEQIEVTAIYHHGSSIDGALELAARYGIPRIYGKFSEMLRSERADFIYIALVNSAHYEYAKIALEHDFHVIVEKPLCVRAGQTRELVKLAQERKLFLFEAISTLHLQNYKSLKDSIKGLGPIRMVQCDFSKRSSVYDRYCKQDVPYSLNPAYEGGALNDINVYNINFVVDLFGKPEDVGYIARYGYNGIDLSGTAILKYPDFYAYCTGSKDSSSPGRLVVQGDRGYICSDGFPNEMPKLELNIMGRSGTYKLNRYPHRMSHEFEDFERVWSENDYMKARFWLETAVNVAEVLEQAAQSGKAGQPKRLKKETANAGYAKDAASGTAAGGAIAVGGKADTGAAAKQAAIAGTGASVAARGAIVGTGVAAQADSDSGEENWTVEDLWEDDETEES